MYEGKVVRNKSIKFRLGFAFGIVWSAALLASDARERLQITPYVGYGSGRKIVAIGRVTTPIEMEPGAGRWRRFRNNLARLAARDKAGVLVRVTVAGASALGRTDDEGYYRILLDLPEAARSKDGFLTGETSLAPSKKYRARPVGTRFVVPAPATRFGVVSDIDDTVIVADMRDKAKMVRHMVFGDACAVRAFRGCAEFYQALRRGEGEEANPFFYVSGSPWRLYDLITSAFRRLSVPRGYMRLRHIGVGSEADPLFDMKAYKKPNILRILDEYPSLKFVLIGDSSQKDPETYADIATHARYRDRIAAVYIRDVNSITDRKRRAQLAKLADRVGPHFVVFENTYQAARHAASIGLISPAGLERVRKATALSGSLAGKPATRYPIVLVHGLLGFSRIGLDEFGAITYFRGIHPCLEAHGYRVFAPGLSMTDGVAVRAGQLKRAIDRFTSGKVNIIAHSMGGLDARYMITHLGMADRVPALITIATPHRGSSFADWGVKHAGRAVPLLQALGAHTQAFYDLTTAACKEFNKKTPDMPQVRYYSYSGTQRRKDIYIGLRFSYNIILQREGPNDGLVSVRSAKWGEYLGNLDADHLNLVGWRFPWERGEKFDAKRFYLDLARMLQKQGF